MGLIAGLDYETIAAEFGVGKRTIRGYVEAMHNKIIGLEDLEPAHAIVTYMLWVDWSTAQAS
jgi:hypothetical protein